MSQSSTCARCGRVNDPGLAFCLDCGQALASASPPAEPCPSCGAPLGPGHRFCGSCGKPTGRQNTPAPPAKRSPADPLLTPIPFSLERVAPRGQGHIRLSLVRSDGKLGAAFSIQSDEAICGRTEGDVRLSDDQTVSPRHARFTTAGGILRVEDLDSVNGIFLKLREPRRFSAGDEVRVGRQLLRLEPLPRPDKAAEDGVRPWGSRDAGQRFRLSQLLEGGGVGDVFLLREGENVVGREVGEVIFPADRYVSARHARIEVRGDEVTLSDAGSSNGTFVRLSRPTDLAIGDQLLVGTQLLRVE